MAQALSFLPSALLRQIFPGCAEIDEEGFISSLGKRSQACFPPDCQNSSPFLSLISSFAVSLFLHDLTCVVFWPDLAVWS